MEDTGRGEQRWDQKGEATSWGYVTKRGSPCLTRVHPCRQTWEAKGIHASEFPAWQWERWVMVAPFPICSNGGVDWVPFWAASQVAKWPLRERMQGSWCLARTLRFASAKRWVGPQQLATTYMCVYTGTCMYAHKHRHYYFSISEYVWV